MKRILILLLLLAAGAGLGCAADRTEAPTPQTQPVKVEVRLMSDPAVQITRAADENGIRDVNLYCFGRSNGRSVHIYSESSLLRFECMPGEYDLFVAANLHADLGDMTPAQLRQYTIAAKNNYADLTMSAATLLTIAPEKGSNTVTLPALSVRRNMAKVAYRIRVADTAPDIELRTVQLVSVPKLSNLFTEAAAPSALTADYTNNPLITIPDAARRDYSGVQYLFENPQGTVPSISDQRDKDAANAPAHATSLMIRAVRGSRILYYRVYLGQNNTDDFNVRRNSTQTLDITILGDADVDTRVHGYGLSVTDDFEKHRLGDYCVLPYSASLYLNIERTDDVPALDAELNVITALDGPFLIDYDECVADFGLDIYHQHGENYYEVTYYPKVVTQANARLEYEVAVRDDYGYSSFFTFEHHFANEIYVATGMGEVTATGALYASEDEKGGLRAACYEEGCTLTAHDKPGFRFVGWYADAALTQQLSASMTYTHRPTSPRNTLYTKYVVDEIHILTDIYTVDFWCDGPVKVDQDEESFIVPYGAECRIRPLEPPLFLGWYDSFDKSKRRLISTDVPYTFIAQENRTIAPAYIAGVNLSASATANCYLAPSLNTAYYFNARVQGNGKATTAITPHTLSGRSVRVIWETGSRSGAVIQSVGFDGDRISFKTGTERGNALIGLFDAGNECIWSWLVWATGADLNANAVAYNTGFTFMDRNLGAETTDPRDVKCKGLYYQWGRPTPFPYPATYNGSAPAAVNYADGFALKAYNPQFQSVPSSFATLAWAIAHPTTLLGNAANPAGGIPAYISSWLAEPNPNLWGNASTGYFYSDQSAKSIYDPCPAGWRVPPPQAWNLNYFKGNTEVASYGWYMTYGMGSNTVFHPFTGELSAGAGNAYFSYTSSWAYLWSNAPGRRSDAMTIVEPSQASVINILSGGVAQKNLQHGQDSAFPVRCVKE